MSNFLDNLKKAVENGEFNSEAAKKINEINELADKKSIEQLPHDLEDTLKNRVDEGGVKKVEEEEISELNTEYVKKMEYFKKEDERNKDILNITIMGQQFIEILNTLNDLKEKYSTDDEILSKIKKIESGEYDPNELEQ